MQIESYHRSTWLHEVCGLEQSPNSGTKCCFCYQSSSAVLSVAPCCRFKLCWEFQNFAGSHSRITRDKRPLCLVCKQILLLLAFTSSRRSKTSLLNSNDFSLLLWLCTQLWIYGKQMLMKSVSTSRMNLIHTFEFTRWKQGGRLLLWLSELLYKSSVT